MKATAALISSLAASSILFVSACSWKVPPDLSPVREANTKNQVVQYLGEPEQSWQFDEYAVTLHYLGIPKSDQADFNQSAAFATGYTLGLATPFVLVEAAGHKNEHGIFLLSCFDDEDRLLSTTQKRGLQSATQHVERFAEMACMRTCETPFTQAVRLSAEEQVQISRSCHADNVRVLCFAAHQGHTDAQNTLAYWYSVGHEPIDQDFVRAYLFYGLAGREGAKERMASKLTPDQIAEAERLVAEWEPNPADC